MDKLLKSLFVAVCCAVSLNVSASPNTQAAKSNYTAKQWEYYAADEYAGGTGTKEDPYQIATVEQFMKLVVEVENLAEDENNWGGDYSAGKYWIQTADLVFNTDLLSKVPMTTDVAYENATEMITQPAEPALSPSGIRSCLGVGYFTSEHEWQYFAGSYDGQGHKISGIYIVKGKNGQSGLFNQAKGAVIKNLRMEDSMLYTNSLTGMIAGQVSGGMVVNCQTSGYVMASGSDDAGVVGRVQDGAIVANCVSNARIWGKNNVAGLAGQLRDNGSLTNGFFYGEIGPRQWGGSSMKWLGAVAAEILTTDVAVTDCFWKKEIRVRNLAGCSSAVQKAVDEDGVLPATIVGAGHFECDESCVAVAEADLPALLETLNNNAATIAGACKWVLDGDGIPTIDFSVRANDIEADLGDIGEGGKTEEVYYPTADQKLLAFPTAEGFGKFASGGRGGKVVVVTNLEDDEEGAVEGSLRWALKQYPGEPLTVVFNVSGWIIQKAPLKIKRDNLTIAGQTAPGEGITLYPRGLSINGSKNVIIRNIRARCGSKAWDGTDLIAGASIVDQAFNAENAEQIVVDHCTFGWSAEEILNNQTSHMQSYTYNLLHEGLYDAGHHKGGARGFGAQWGGGQTTIYRNMIAHCNSRSPRFQGARVSAGDITVYNEYVNNINFNWGGWGACYGGENDQAGRYGAHQVNFCNNYYRQGPATRKAVNTNNLKFVRASVATQVAEWHLSGNFMDGSETVTADNAKGFTADGNASLAPLRDEFLVPQKFYPSYHFDVNAYTVKDRMLSAEEAFSDVLAHVGCINRDAIEERVIEECRNGSASHHGDWGGNYKDSGIIDDPSDLTDEMAYDENGFLYCTVARKAEARPDDFDTDGDGMPDAWELAHGLNPKDCEDRNTLTSEGYTALEVYLCELMGETIEGLAVETTDALVTIVAKDGSGDFKTVTEAVNAAPEGGQRTIILVKSGTYKEHVAIPQGKVISILGEDRENTILTYDKSYPSVPEHPDSTCTLCVSGQYFYGENFTSENTVGPDGGQAGCLFNYKGDCMVVKNMNLKANQDGVRFNTNTRNYIKDCYIEGTVDYIYDSGIAFIDDCEIKQVNRAGFILAPGNCSAVVPREVANKFTGINRVFGIGLFVRNSTLTYDPETISSGSTYLGRPWGKVNNAGYYLYCKMDKHINGLGWCDMNDNAANGTPCYLGEYGSMDMNGRAKSIARRVSWAWTDAETGKTDKPYMTKKVADVLFDINRIDSLVVDQLNAAGKNLKRFDPTVMVRKPGVPAELFITDTQLSWSPVAGGLAGYIIYNNGKIVGYSKTCQFSIQRKEGDRYTLRSMSATGCLSDAVSFDGSSDGIKEVHVSQPRYPRAVYNLAGQRVDANYKGIVIRNGRKTISK